MLLSTANTVLALSRLSVGGLAASIVEPRAVFRTALLGIAVYDHIIVTETGFASLAEQGLCGASDTVC